jgi:hypothetical protein
MLRGSSHMPVLQFIYRHVLNSVPFGIATMALIGLYIAIGSGFAPFREYFEMDEILFFNWWPLKILMAMLVINLTVVTFVRIPLTLPRYGVWTIHTGIVLLVISTAVYYSRKVEGLTMIPLGQATSVFYDRWERALYATVDDRATFRPVTPIALTTLPRFHVYSESTGNAGYLQRRGLSGLRLVGRELDRSDPQNVVARDVPLHKVLGTPDPIETDVVAYYPYALVQTDWLPDAPDGKVGLTIEKLQGADDLKLPGGLAFWDDDGGSMRIGSAELQHRHLPTRGDVDMVVASVKRLHKLNIKLRDAYSRDVTLTPGEELKLGETGYTLRMEGFTPNWPAIDGVVLPAVSLMVSRPEGEQREFRRMILSGRPVQTDFILNAPGSGPMGARQQKPLDESLVITYEFTDPNELFPKTAASRELLLTSDDSPVLTRVKVDGTHPVEVSDHDDGVATFLTGDDLHDHGSIAGMFGAGGNEKVVAAIRVKRHASLATNQRVDVPPPANRDRNEAAAGVRQVVSLRVRSGNWSRVVHVPFAQFPHLAPPTSSGVLVPGASAAVKFTLSTTRRRIGGDYAPVQVKLDKFTATPYAGAPVGPGSVMRDFRSDITLTLASGKTIATGAQLNEPAFVDNSLMIWPFNESWLLYQAQWDAQRQRFTVLGVGNRPAVGVMAIACVMIFAGLLYAFYAKPVIIRRMKQKALERARQARLPVGEAA